MGLSEIKDLMQKGRFDQSLKVIDELKPEDQLDGLILKSRILWWKGERIQDPIFPSFLLGLIDTFEYMDRFSLSNEKPIIKPFDRKFLVDINLQNTFDKKIYKKFFTGVKKPYYVIKCNYLILEDNKGNKRIKESELTDIIREYASKRLVNLSRCFMFSERFSILVILFIEGKLKFKIVFFGELPSKEKLAKTDVLKW